MEFKIRKIKDLLARNLDSYAAFQMKNCFLKSSGWLKSFREKSAIDFDGNPIPWMTYSFISFLDNKINRDMKIFEYGCGNSTLWWAKRAQSVISCEHDKEWFEKYKLKIPSNVILHNIDLEYGGKYSLKIRDYQAEFDIIVIDGRDRVNCVLNSLAALKSDGVIIWDNSERNEYQKGFIFLEDNKYKRLDFFGIGPINSYPWCTSIFYKNINCLGI
jgi:hypothetical protein